MMLDHSQRNQRLGMSLLLLFLAMLAGSVGYIIWFHR